jgi:site-specific recombinase XerD
MTLHVIRNDRPDDLHEFAEYLRDRGTSPGTVAAYTKDLRMFFDWRATLDIHGTEEVDLLSWVRSMRERGLGAATLRRRIATGRSWLRFQGQDKSMLNTYRCPPLPPARPHPLPDGAADLRRMLAVSRGPTRWAIALGGFAGLRIAETCSIAREDVNAGRRELKVKGKGEKVRHIPISSSLAAIMEEMPQEGRLVPIVPTVARRYITAAAKRAGIATDVSSHDLRATFATECYKATNDVMMVSRLLGHASVVTTQVYLGWDQEGMHRAVEF